MFGGAPARPGRTCPAVGLLVGQPAAAEHRHGVAARAAARIAARRVARRGRAPRPRTAGSARRRHRGPAGVVSRSGARSSAALVQPFWHSPPRLVGKSAARRPCTAPSAEVCRRLRALQRAVGAVRGGTAVVTARGRVIRCRRAERGAAPALVDGPRGRGHDQVQRRRTPTGRATSDPSASLEMANPRGMRKPPNAPTAPAMPMQPAAALRAARRPSGSVARRRKTAGIIR